MVFYKVKDVGIQIEITPLLGSVICLWLFVSKVIFPSLIFNCLIQQILTCLSEWNLLFLVSIVEMGTQQLWLSAPVRSDKS